MSRVNLKLVCSLWVNSKTADTIYNIGTGALGVDPSVNDPNTESGLREMMPLEQTLRVTGGVVTATGVSSQLGGASSTARGTSATVAEAVTPEGVRVPVRAADDAVNATSIEARGSRQLSGARGVKFEEQALEQARAAHPQGFKPDAETQRLGLTNRPAADYVGLQVTKSGNYIAHITEITVKNKPLSEIGKQLDGAQKIASSKMGDKITKYEFYVRTDSKELVDALAKANNRIQKPGASGNYFDIKVIFERGSK